MQFCLLALYTLTLLTLTVDAYIGAVYEHDVIFPINRTGVVSRQEAVQDMMKNLRVYSSQTRQAAKQNASIIVFPEYGTYGLGWTRKTIMPYLEYVPDPEVICWNPCEKPAGFPDDEVQSYLSCIAKNNSIFVVANIGARQPCSVFDKQCPVDGAYQFSTNVVYNQHGYFIARYFKYNLGKEEAHFDKPQVVNHTTFETPFGRFGTFTSSDILYKDPAVTLIQDMNITNIAYPTAWKEELPLMSAIEFHSAFAEGMLVSILAANIHIPTLGYYGSGLYWPYYTSIDGSYVYEDSLTSQSSLVIANVTRFVFPHSEKLEDTPNGIKGLLQTSAMTSSQTNEWPSRKHKLKINGDEYTAVVFKHSVGVYNPRVCQGQLCCDAGIEALFPGDELFAFGAFDGYHNDGLHGNEGGYYLQSCVFIKCANTTPESCGSPTKTSTTDLGKMSFAGNFTSGVVFPEVLSTYDGELGIVTRIWLYQGAVIIDAGISGAPIAVAMLNRDYSRDGPIATFASGHQERLRTISFAGNFTSGVVFPEVLYTYDGELGIVTRIWLYQGAVIIDAGISGAPIAVAMLNRDYSRDGPVGRPTFASGHQERLGTMSFSGNFTSGVVFPEVLYTYDGELGIVMRIWLYQEAVIIDAGISGAPIAVAMLNRDYSRDGPVGRR